MEHKYKVGDLVIYEGVIGKVDELTKSFGGTLMLSLISIDNEELTCTALESACEQYDGEEFDQSEGLLIAQANSKRIKNFIGGLTDKNFRDGNH